MIKSIMYDLYYILKINLSKIYCYYIPIDFLLYNFIINTFFLLLKLYNLNYDLLNNLDTFNVLINNFLS